MDKARRQVEVQHLWRNHEGESGRRNALEANHSSPQLLHTHLGEPLKQLPFFDGTHAEQLNVRIGAGQHLVRDVQRFKVVGRVHNQVRRSLGNTVSPIVFRAGFPQLSDHRLVWLQEKRFSDNGSARTDSSSPQRITGGVDVGNARVACRSGAGCRRNVGQDQCPVNTASSAATNILFH